MRDPERIDPMLAKIRELWKQYPDWRLGQLVINVAGDGGDLFYTEDDRMLEMLDESIKLARERA